MQLPTVHSSVGAGIQLLHALSLDWFSDLPYPTARVEAAELVPLPPSYLLLTSALPPPCHFEDEPRVSPQRAKHQTGYTEG